MYLSKNKKSGIYYIYFRKDDGNKTRVSTRTKFKKEALKYLTTFERELKNRKPSNIITLGECRKLYFTSIEATHQRSSFRHSRKSLEKLIDYIGEDVNVGDITKAQVETYIYNFYKFSPHSASLSHRNLKAVFNKLIDWGYLEKNVWRGIKLKIPINDPVFISKEELELIVEKEKNPILKATYIFGFNTGMRLSEITNCVWTNVDLRLRLIRVNNSAEFITKSKRKRVVPINDHVYGLLLNLNHNSKYVFE